jgi:hypothetical protein
MSARRIAAIALAGGLLAGGTGVAIAAVSKDDGAKTEQAILGNAAKRLNVTPDKLRDALAAAQDDQLDQMVKDGTLTQKQADAIKARRKQSGRVLGGPFGPSSTSRRRSGSPARSSRRSCAPARACPTSPRRRASRSTTCAPR